MLPSGLSAVGTRSGGPVAGSLAQSGLAVVVVAVFVVTGLDPVLTLFTWFSGMSAVGVVLLMAATSAAVVGYFARERSKRSEASVWARVIAPGIASLLLFALLVVLVGNFDALLGTDPSSPLRWILPGLVLLSAVGGVVGAAVLRRIRPMTWSGIGRSTMPEESGAAEPERAPKPYLREHDTEVTTKIDRLS